MAIRVAVVGAKGRMGQEVCRAIDSDKDLELVAQIDLNDSLTKAVEGKADVIVDFTNATAAAKTAEFAIENGINLVIGATGFEKKSIDEILTERVFLSFFPDGPVSSLLGLRPGVTLGRRACVAYGHRDGLG